MIRSLGLFHHVDMPGFVENPYAFMGRAGVFVLSSRHEGMPNALMEALAFDLPLVATDCESGPREILADGKYGTLVPVGQPSPLAGAITAAMEAPLQATRERKTAGDRFSLSGCLDKYEEVFRAVTSGMPNRRHPGFRWSTEGDD